MVANYEMLSKVLCNNCFVHNYFIVFLTLLHKGVFLITPSVPFIYTDWNVSQRLRKTLKK